MKKNDLVSWIFAILATAGIILGFIMVMVLDKRLDNTVKEIMPTQAPSLQDDHLQAQIDILTERVEALENSKPTLTPTVTPTVTSTPVKPNIQVTANSVRYLEENIEIAITDEYVFDDEIIGSGMLTLVELKHSRVVYVHLDNLYDLDIQDAYFNGRDYSWTIQEGDRFAKKAYKISDEYAIVIYMPIDIWNGIDDIGKALDTIWIAMEVTAG